MEIGAMNSPLDWIALAAGCLGVCVAVIYWRVAQKVSLHLQEAQRNLQNRQGDLEQSEYALQDVRLEFQRLRDTPPMPTDEQLAAHLTALSARMTMCVEELDSVRLKSEAPQRNALQEAEESRVVDRKERFSGYHDVLARSNAKIGLCIDRLLATQPLVVGLRDALKSGDLDTLVGHSEIVAIVEVFEALDREISSDDAWNNSVRSIKGEFNRVLKARDAMKSIDRRAREAERVAAAIDFGRHNVPQPTPLEKFRRLKPTGFRDGFG
jgi:hypothetical protein